VKLSRSEILTALKRAGRKRLVDEWAERIHAGLSSEQLRLSAVLQHAYAISVRSTADVIAALVEQINTIEAELVKHLDLHPDAMIYLSQPGMGEMSAAGCSASSEMTAPATPERKHGRTTPTPARSRSRLAEGPPLAPGASATHG
jgi:transposase